MRCLVTGAAGFIGSTLSERLLRDGHSVVGIDCFTDYYNRSVKEHNISRARSNQNYTFIEGDINKVDIVELLQGVDWVFHQAAQAGVRASWGSYFDTYTYHNVNASQRILEASRSVGTVKKVVYASSSSIYGNAESYPTPESKTPAPISPYGVTKLAAEHLMCLYAKEFGVPTVSLRYFTVYGPRQRPDMAFHRFIRAGLTGSEITIYGDGEQMRDFTFIEDIVTANISAATSGKSGEVYNLGGGTNATVNEVLSIISKEIGELIVNRVDRQAGDAKRTSADTVRAQKDLAFAPTYSLEEGIRAEIEWLRGELSEGR